MTSKMARAIALTIFAVGVAGGSMVFADDRGRSAHGEMPMMNQMQDMQGHGMGGMMGTGGMMGMMGMMSAMTDMMQTCNRMMQATLPEERPPSESDQDG